MIDTNKYTGHTEGRWVLGEYKDCISIEAIEDDTPNTSTIVIGKGSKVGRINLRQADLALLLDAPLLLEEVERLHEVINKAMQQDTVLDMRKELFESCCIDAEGQYESGHWEREEE